MEFVLRKANYASFNDLLRRNIVEIAEKCEEFNDENVFFLILLMNWNNLNFYLRMNN